MATMPWILEAKRLIESAQQLVGLIENAVQIEQAYDTAMPMLGQQAIPQDESRMACWKELHEQINVLATATTQTEGVLSAFIAQRS